MLAMGFFGYTFFPMEELVLRMWSDIGEFGWEELSVQMLFADRGSDDGEGEGVTGGFLCLFLNSLELLEVVK